MGGTECPSHSPDMRKFAAITVILSLLFSLLGEAAHACAPANELPVSAKSDTTTLPCHGKADVPVMDCCKNMLESPGPCVDCSCPAMASPAGVPEADRTASALTAQRYDPSLPDAVPPDGPPEYHLRPPISRL